jgi:hypothetical protein
MSTEKVSIIYDERRAKGKPWLVRWFGEATETARPKRYSKGFKLKKLAEIFATEKQHEFDQGEKKGQTSPCDVGTIFQRLAQIETSGTASWNLGTLSGNL